MRGSIAAALVLTAAATLRAHDGLTPGDVEAAIAVGERSVVEPHVLDMVAAFPVDALATDAAAWR